MSFTLWLLCWGRKVLSTPMIIKHRNLWFEQESWFGFVWPHHTEMGKSEKKQEGPGIWQCPYFTDQLPGNGHLYNCSQDIMNSENNNGLKWAALRDASVEKFDWRFTCWSEKKEEFCNFWFWNRSGEVYVIAFCHAKKYLRRWFLEVHSPRLGCPISLVFSEGSTQWDTQGARMQWKSTQWDTQGVRMPKKV